MDRLSNNQSFLIESAVEQIIGYIVVDENIEYDVALDKFYTSKTFEHLSDVKTGLYLQGSAYVYELYKKEIK